MFKKSLFENLLGKKKPEELDTTPVDAEGVVEHQWMTQIHDKKVKKVYKTEPKVDTAIMRNRIAEKISKLNNH